MRNRLKELREGKGVGGAELGQALRHPVTRQTIHAIENDKWAPSLTLALDLAHYFTTTVEEIFSVD